MLLSEGSGDSGGKLIACGVYSGLARGGPQPDDLTRTKGRRESESMRTVAHHHTALVGLAVVALMTVGCSNGQSVDASSPQVGLIATSEDRSPANRGKAHRGAGTSR